MSSFHGELRAFSAAIERELVQRELAFPTVLDLSLRIRRLAGDPASTIGDIARLVQLEPVLAARVVRSANSVVFNPGGHPVAGVPEAIQRIGIAQVRVTALVVAMDQLAQEHRSHAMRGLARDVWAHSVGVGTWSSAIARTRRIGHPDTAMLAGLLADVGHLFLIARVGHYPAVAADPQAFREIAQFWGAALTRAIVDTLDLPGEALDDVESIDAWQAEWPPETLKDVVHVGALVAEPPNPIDPERARRRAARREELAAAARDPTLDELLVAAAPARTALLEVLGT